jgi:hypothetical protein
MLCVVGSRMVHLSGDFIVAAPCRPGEAFDIGILLRRTYVYIHTLVTS